MGFVDQPVGLILAYGAFNMAFATWMLQSYFATIPLGNHGLWLTLLLFLLARGGIQQWMYWRRGLDLA